MGIMMKKHCQNTAEQGKKLGQKFRTLAGCNVDDLTFEQKYNTDALNLPQKTS